MPQYAITDTEIEACFEIMAELRPHLKRQEFVSSVREMEAEGFRLIHLAIENKIVAAAGSRISTNFFMGKHLYVDDLVTTDAERSSGA
jgi:hypothetical protein